MLLCKLANVFHALGSGCIAALEAEKFLVEHDSTVENGVEEDGEVKKSQASSAVPEYKSNPLL